MVVHVHVTRAPSITSHSFTSHTYSFFFFSLLILGSLCVYILTVYAPLGFCLFLRRLTAQGPDGDGNTPAEMARLEGHVELSDWLIQAAAEAGAGRGDERTG